MAGGVPQKTLSWLYDVLKREYRDPNRTYSDLAHVLNRYPGFGPRTDVYTFENGASALLVHFQGTIPVNFRGNTYRFPISLWIPHTYPYDAPIAYVNPTDDMVIRPGQYVGGDGKIYHPYLAQWRDAWDRSYLIDFLSILSDVFAKEPPVISRTQQQQRQALQNPPPVPPLPREIQPPAASSPAVPSSQSPRASPGPPPPPPKDFAQGGPAPSPASSGPIAQRQGRYDAPPPLPSEGQPGGQAHPRPQPPYGNGSVQRPTSGMNYMPQRTSSLRQSTPAQPPHPSPGYDQSQQQQQQYRPQPPRPGDAQQQQYPPSQPPLPPGPDPRNPPQPQAYNQSWQRPPPTTQGYSERPTSHHYSQSTPLPGQYHQPQHQGPPYAQPQQPPYQQPHHPPPQPQPQPAKPPPPPNLLDSPFDIPLPAPSASATISKNPNIPVPPIPVNPEKEALLSHLSHQVTQSLHQQISQSTSALPALSSQNAALQSTLQNLSTELNNLQTLHSTTSSNLNLLSSSLSKSDKVITSAHARSSANDIPAVDEMLVPPRVVARQLYDAACEERGIEAAILALQEGFVRGRIGGDVWSRRTRELAREGFKRRWIERKVARGMALDMGMLGNGV